MNGTMDKLREVLAKLSGRQRVQLGLALVATLGLIWGFTVWSSRVRYGVLYGNLTREDAGAVVTALKERQVDHRVSAGGTMIEVPMERIDEVRLELAGEGIPPGGGAGFELFDKPAFGLSDFVQNVNYRRALERELGRTIQSLDVVESARVHLALPPESVFADERREPSASVVLRLRSGHKLPAGRVRAVTNLVASGVEGLDPQRVSVIDGEGRMLTTGEEDDPADALSATQVEAKHAMEKNVESTLLAMLEPLVGVGNVRARATVELNMTRIERVQETYDPNGAVVRSETKSKMRNEAGGPGGIPGTASNLPGGGGGAAAAGGSGSNSQDTMTNYELSKTVSTISEPVGTLARQSVAVVVDHAMVESTGDGAAAERVPTPRSAEEMQKITNLVRAAIGFDETRGDQLIVQNVPFDEAVQLDAGGGGGFAWDTVLRVLRYASLPLAVLLLALLVFRPAIAAVRGLKESGAGDSGPMTVAQLQAQVQGQLGAGQVPALAEGGSPLRRKLMEAVSEDPQTAALVIRNWLDRRKGKE